MLEVNEIKISDIRTSELNWYKDYNVEELAQLIEEQGQLEPAAVYVDEQEDGRHYTLISGERRYRAIAYLFERGRHNGFMRCIVHEKPTVEVAEKNLLSAYNAYRAKSKDEILYEIKQALEYWNYLVSIDRKPTLRNGQKKRDWIGARVGLKGRQVQEYIGMIQNEQTTTNENTNTNRVLSNQELVINDLRRAQKNIKKAYREQQLGDSVSVRLSDLYNAVDEFIIHIQRTYVE